MKYELEAAGLPLENNDSAMQFVLNYWCGIQNKFSTSEFGRTPKEELFEKIIPSDCSARFGQKVLAEVPESVESDTRFVEAMYLHCCINGQLGHVCLAGDRLFVARSLKLINPVAYADRISPGVICEKGDFMEERPAVDLDVIPEAVDANVMVPYDGRTNPPIAWYRAHGYTKGCKACSDGVKGRARSAACKRRYSQWLDEQRKKLSGGPSSSSSGQAQRPQPFVYVPGPGGSDPSKKVVPEVPYEPSWMAEDDVPDPASVDEASGAVQGEPSWKRYRLTGKQDGSNVYRPGDVRNPDNRPLAIEDGSMDVDAAEPTAGIPDDSQDVADMLEMDINRLIANALREFDMLSSVMYDENRREQITLCNETVWQSVPISVKDESANEFLDQKLTMAGFKREYKSMHDKTVGRCVRGFEAKALAE